MTDFANWSLGRQKQFWRETALELLTRWRIEDAEFSLLGYSTNAVFKVSVKEAAFVMRLHAPGRVAASHLRSELLWLLHIRGSTELLCPQPIAPADSPDRFVEYHSERFAGKTGYAVLFAFLDGEPKPPHALTPADMGRIGRYLGELHTRAQFVPPPDFTRPRLDHAGFFGADSPYRKAASSITLTPEQSAIFAETERGVVSVMRALESNAESRGLIHGDMLLKNILFRPASIAALDFEYCGFGPFLYDLAPLIWQLRGDRPADCAELESSVWSAYAALRPAAEKERAHLEVMIAARQLASCRWLLSQAHHPNIRKIAPELLAARAMELRDYLISGILRRQSRTL